MKIFYRSGFWYDNTIGTNCKEDGVNLEPTYYSMTLTHLAFHVRANTLAACLPFSLGQDPSYKRVDSHI